jgi:hypothetical protein
VIGNGPQHLAATKNLVGPSNLKQRFLQYLTGKLCVVVFVDHRSVGELTVGQPSWSDHAPLDARYFSEAETFVWIFILSFLDTHRQFWAQLERRAVTKSFQSGH